MAKLLCSDLVNKTLKIVYNHQRKRDVRCLKPQAIQPELNFKKMVIYQQSNCVNEKQVSFRFGFVLSISINPLPHTDASLQTDQIQIRQLLESYLIWVYLFAYGNMIRYDPTLVDLTSISLFNA